LTSIYPNKQGAFYENGSSWHHSIFSFLIVSCDKPKEKTVILPLTNTINNTIENTNVSVKVTKSLSQSITSGDYTALTFDTETFDTDNMHDNTTNPTRLTVNTAGLYIIEATVASQSFASGTLVCTLLLNGTTAIGYNGINDLNNGDPNYLEISTIYNLSQGDYIELFASQDSGVNIAIFVTGTNFSMARLSESE